jgi:glycerate 2-kinase
MAAGALQALGEQFLRGLSITRDGHTDPLFQQDARFICMEAGHPVPDVRSLQAGDSLCRFLDEVPLDAEIIFLVSGGASSLVEVLPDPIRLEQLQQLNRWLIASGLGISAINRVRRSVSLIKGGGLIKYLRGRKTTALLISDVAGDDPAIIGSGLLYPGVDYDLSVPGLPGWILAMIRAGERTQESDDSVHGPIGHHVVASLDTALKAAALTGGELGYDSQIMDERLEGEAADTGARLVEQLRDSQAGLYLWGGETTVTLPANPGKGGRNQQLALAAACAMVDGDTIVLLSAGTDGTDGSTLAAGAVVDPATISRGTASGLDCGHCLMNADSGSYLEACGDVFVTGPTGTNVTDMVIGIKLDENL